MYSEYISYLKQVLNEHRFQHSLNVAEKCAELSELYGFDKEKAYLCGLLHDICKNDSEEKMLQIFDKFDIILDNVQKSVKSLWHSIAGAALIQEKFNILDIEIIDAIKYHTTARANMSKLEKIVFIADVISKDRDFDCVEKLREYSLVDLDLAVIECLKSSINNLTNKNALIHIDTINAYNFMIAERK